MVVLRNIDMTLNKVTNLANGTAGSDAVNLSQLNAVALPSGANGNVLIHNGTSWVAQAQSALQSGVNYWTLSGGNVYRSTGLVGLGTANPIALVSNTATAFDDNYGTAGNQSGFAFNGGTASINYIGAFRNEADTGTLGGAGLLVQADIQGRGTYVLSVTRSNAAKTRLFTVKGDGQTHVGVLSSGTRAFNVSGESYFAGNVGIGELLPSARLHVNGGDIYCFNNGGNPRFLFGDSVSAGTYGGFRWDSAGDILQIFTDTGGIGNGINLLESNRVLIGTASDNGIDRLQVAGNVLINNTIKTTNALLTLNANGVTASLASNGTFALPFNTVAPTGVIDGRVWSYQVVVGNIKIQYGKTSGVIRTVANVEEDITGTSAISGAATQSIGGIVRFIDIDANANAVTVTVGNTSGGTDMVDGQVYSVRCRRNGTNAITFNAAAGYNFGINGVSTLLPVTFVAAPYQVIRFVKHGSQIHVA